MADRGLGRTRARELFVETFLKSLAAGFDARSHRRLTPIFADTLTPALSQREREEYGYQA